MTAVPVVLSPEPFSRAVEYMEAPAGQTVRAMLLEAVSAEKIALDALSRAVLYVDGVAIPRDEALDRVLADGETVNIVVEPMGGGGGGGGKDVGQILLTIAVIAVSTWIGGPTGPLKAWPVIARVAAAAAVQVAGSMAIEAIFKPGQQAQVEAADRYALQGASNQYRQWQPFPMALGEVIAAPDFVAKTFTQNEGDEQWIYGILGLHYGPCEVSEERIGDTLISSMGPQDVRIVRHLTPGPRTFSLYPNDVEQLDLSEKFDEGVEIVRVAPQEGQRFDFDLYFPGGLHWRDDKARYNVEQNDIDVSWRPVNEDGEATGAWSSNTRWTFRSSTYDPLRLTRTISLPLGRYEFRLKKLNKPADQGNKRVDDMYWTAIKAVAFRKPLTDETLSIIEFAVRATAITQGTLATITCRIKPIMETWNGSTWGPPQPTSNPAAIARWLLTGPAPAKPMLPIQADARLRAWSQLCDQYGWTSNIYLTEDRKQDAALALLEQSGRASLFWDGTQVAASPWVEKPAPRQMFAGDNLRDHSWQIVYPDEVHALRIEFQNIERRGEPDELYVYADGYAEQADASKGIQAANLVEAMRLEGQRTMAQAYKDGRWALGMRLHQRRVDTWSTGFDNLACSYGDRVRLAWSRVDGGDSMRVRCRRWAGALVSGLRLTQPVEMVAGVDYAVDMRLKSGVVTNVPVVTTPGVTREVQFQTPRGADFTAAADDLVVFGVPGRITEDVEVIGIEPGEDLTARITGMRYVAPLLMAGETGPIPPLQTRLTGDRQKDPPQPTLLGMQVSADGVRVGFSMPPWKGAPISGFAVRWRTAPEAGETVSWAPLPGLPANAMTLTTPPLREAPRALSGAETTRVQIEIVAATADGRTSPALIVTAQEDVVPTPLPGDWTITPFSVAPDGSRQLGFNVEGRVSVDEIKRVLIEWGPSANGPWKAAYDGPPVEGVVRTTITVDAPGQYWFPISHWSAQGVPGGRLVYGPDTVEGQIAGDTAAVAGYPASDLLKDVQNVETLAGQTRDAVADLEQVYGDTVSAAASAASAIQQAAIATQAKADAIIAEGGALAARADSIAARADAILAAGSAADRASEANEERIKAETARGLAETYRNQSAASATTATGAASTATEQAGLAATARGEAQGFAGSALDYRNQASGFVSAAEAAAAVSTTQKLEAVAALNAMGRQNIVARENVSTPADVFTVTTGGVSGWGFSMVGSGGVVLREIKVGPLKKNTAYSVSFLARRTAGTASLPIVIDLFPDSLPQTDIDVSSSSWSRYTWQNIISSSDDMTLTNVSLRFFRTLPAGNAFEITDIKLEEGATATAYTPSPKDAATSAKASAQSASQAFASETAAGQQAATATQERIDAQTARGQAEGFRNQSAASATTATGAAATATEQAGLAATARGEAQGFAGAALDYRNQASGFVTDAEAAAAVSTTQKLEAVAALNAMGRQNIVARERVTTPADVFTVTTGGVSGWGFSMVGSGGGVAVARDIKVGPLKKNTAYSVSFLARRGGVDPVPLNVDLFPDSLPQTAFNVTSENWSRFTWEGVTSASDDMALATVSLRFFATMPAGNAFEITDIKLEEGATATAYTPSPKDAATSAKASAQSASQAFASQTLAGESAGASETAKLAAQTARGQAEGFKNQAVQAYQDAQGQASIATTQAGLASGSANLAGDKAQAASDSASLASTKADAAGVSAQAAEVSKLQASSSYDAAAQLLYQQFPPTLAPDSRGSYEGYGSIVGPNNWPTPYISQELAGTITYREFRHKRRIPKLAGKRYRFECWVYTYATNVRFSVHRHDYPNQTGTAGSRYRGQMPAAPTGSPNIKPPTQTFTLVAGEFEVLSDDQAFLAPYLAAESDNGQPNNGLFHIGGIAITDITSEKKATTAAEAAVIQASSAATFAGQSEDWAKASKEQAILASGSAGNAKTYRDESATARDGSVIASSSASLSATASDTARDLSEKARDKALEHRNAASTQAGIAEDKAAEASASASAASISASLAASTSAVRGNLLPNGGMERGLEGISGPNLYVSNDSWGPAVRVAPTGNWTYTVDWAPVNIFAGATYTVSGDALLFADSGQRYFDMIWLNSAGNVVGDSGQKPMGPGDYSNDRARINAMAWTEQAPSNAVKVVVRAVFEGVVNPTAMGARRVKLELGNAPATAYTADATVGALSAGLNITAGVAADVQSRLASARFEVIAAAGGAPAQLLIRADTSGSLARMVASSIGFANVVGGQVIEAMKLIGGNVFITGKLYIGGSPGSGVGYILLDGPNMRIDVVDENSVLRMRIGKLD